MVLRVDAQRPERVLEIEVLSSVAKLNRELSLPLHELLEGKGGSHSSILLRFSVLVGGVDYR